MKIITIFLFLGLLLSGCGKDTDTRTNDKPPTVTTAVPANITSTSVTLGGTITDEGSSTVTERGFCWGLFPNPDLNSGRIYAAGNGTPFTFNLGSLTPATLYYVRAYAKNVFGVSFGPQVTFTTLSPASNIPTLTTSAVTSITSSSAASGGNISSDGGSPVTARGVCWNTSTGPTIANNRTTDGTGTGSFTSAMSGLAASTTYYVRSYATNSAGTAYGNELSFTTSAAAPANVYAAGSERVSTNLYMAKTWKNGVATDLTNGNFDAQAAAIYVSGTDVYAAGYERNASNVLVAKYWKNGVATSLTAGTTNARAFAIFVAGTDVYVAGAENVVPGGVPRYWKNGVPTTLGSSQGYCTGIYVSGTTVYVSGAEVNGSGKYVAKLWINGTPTDLSDGTTNASAWGLYVSGADVYVTGEISDASNVQYAKSWKNGVRTDLAGGNNCIGRSVFVAGSDVHVAGFQVLNQAKLWTNNVLNNLTAVLGNNTYANSVYVHGVDIYASGAENDMPRIWKNGTGTTLSTNAGRTGAAVAVFVTN